MGKEKLCSYITVLAFVVVGTIRVSDSSAADDQRAFGPPAWVMEAWASGNPAVVPPNGPPAWVVEAWQSGANPPDYFSGGPPPGVLARHAAARELGLPGPPPDVVDRWENGEGFDLPGPPDFVLDLLGL